jgi:hypothetical protein
MENKYVVKPAERLLWALVKKSKKINTHYHFRLEEKEGHTTVHLQLKNKNLAPRGVREVQ